MPGIPAGHGHTCALTTTGGVRCWGYNDLGQLGDGTRTNRTSPPESDVVSGVGAIAAGYAHTRALMTTGGVRCWGQDRTSPPESDVLSGVQAIAVGHGHTCALMTTGGVRCWGYDRYGQLGNGCASYCGMPRTVPGICR
jgi:alpha-tubulin suppressor-like RCC1 family protein